MKQRILMILMTLMCIAALICVIFGIAPPSAKREATTHPVEDGISLYHKAIAQIDQATYIGYTVHLTKEMTIGASSFLETAYQSINFDTHTTDKPHILTKETHTIGTHTIDISEIFVDGTVYLTINEVPFLSCCSYDEYKDSKVPPILLNSDIYNSIKAVRTDTEYIVTFDEPKCLEAWLDDPQTTILDANGVVYIDQNGKLMSSTYSATYQQNGTTFRFTTDVNIEPDVISFEPPEDETIYTPINDWKAPLLLEKACGYLTQAKQISTEYNDTIYFGAMGDRREKQTKLYAYFDNEWSVLVETDINTKNDTKLDQSQTNKTVELFLNGQYCKSTNGEQPLYNSEITIDAVYEYLQNLLLSTAVLPQHISTSTIIETESALCINFTGTDAFGNFLAENASNLLYNNPVLITQTGSGLVTKELNCYIIIDKITGLPSSSGIDFIGSYTTEGLPYSLKYNANQTYQIPSNDALAEIKKAADS